PSYDYTQALHSFPTRRFPILTTFYVDVKNQLTGTAGSFTYDDNGNLTASNGTYFTYGYDDENRLTNWTSANTAKTDFTYDGLGRERKSTRLNSSHGSIS